MTGVVSATQKSARLFDMNPCQSFPFVFNVTSTVLLDFHALVQYVC